MNTWLPSLLNQIIAGGDGDRADQLLTIERRAPAGALDDGQLTQLHPLEGRETTAALRAEATAADGRAGLVGLDIEALGIPSQEEAVERYVARTGFPVPPMDWYFAYNLFRLAGIMQGIKKRVIDGTASSAHAQAMSDRVRPLAERAFHFALEAGMPA